MIFFNLELKTTTGKSFPKIIREVAIKLRYEIQETPLSELIGDPWKFEILLN